MPLDLLTNLFAQSQGGGTRDLVDGLARTPLSQVVLFVAVLTGIRIAVFPTLKNTKPHLRIRLYPVAKFTNEMVDAFIYAGVFVFMIIRPFGIQAFLVPSGSMWPTLEVNNFIVANKAIYRYTEPKANDVIVFRPPATAAIRHADLDVEGEMKVDYVKRCIGAPGDLVELKKGVLYRNGSLVDEPYKALSECNDHPQMEDTCQTFRKLSEDTTKQMLLASFKLVSRNGEIIPLNYTDLDANSAEPRTDGSMDGTLPYRSARKFQITGSDDQQKAKDLPAQKVPPGYFLMMGDNRNNSHDGRVWGLVQRDNIIGRAELVWWPISQLHRIH